MLKFKKKNLIIISYDIKVSFLMRKSNMQNIFTLYNVYITMIVLYIPCEYMLYIYVNDRNVCLHMNEYKLIDS